MFAFFWKFTIVIIIVVNNYDSLLLFFFLSCDWMEWKWLLVLHCVGLWADSRENSFNLEEPNCSEKPWLEKKELQKGFKKCRKVEAGC